jgi:cellobiose phosphorylase
LSEWVLALNVSGMNQVKLAVEIMPLLDTMTSPLDYDSVKAKHTRLEGYYESCRHTLSGDKVAVSLEDLAKDLKAKSDWLAAHIRTNEWIQNKDGFGWFNGYYDNDGQRVEGDHPNGIRMTLTGQVFALMGGVATTEQTFEMMRAADRFLLDSSVGGYRLNTDFGEIMLNLGRAFGFAYGHKENGAMFSHMAVMYAYALYRRGLARQGYKVLSDIYRHCQDFSTSRMYPGIPEYVNTSGRGIYTWLTGSASWYVLALITEVFGVRGQHGDLLLAPKLVTEQFDEAGNAAIRTLFGDKLVQVTYQNPDKLDFSHYRVDSISIEGEPVNFLFLNGKATIARKSMLDRAQKTVRITVQLGQV